MAAPLFAGTRCDEQTARCPFRDRRLRSDRLPATEPDVLGDRAADLGAPACGELPIEGVRCRNPRLQRGATLPGRGGPSHRRRRCSARLLRRLRAKPELGHDEHGGRDRSRRGLQARQPRRSYLLRRLAHQRPAPGGAREPGGRLRAPQRRGLRLAQSPRHRSAHRSGQRAGDRLQGGWPPRMPPNGSFPRN